LKYGEKIYFSAKHDLESFLFTQPPSGRLHGPFGAGPGLRPVICLAVFSAILLYNQTHTTIQKTFFFLVHTSIKTVLKNTIVEKQPFSLQNTILKAFCLHSLPPVGFTAPAGPAVAFGHAVAPTARSISSRFT